MLRDIIPEVEETIHADSVTEDVRVAGGGLGLDSIAILEILEDMQTALDFDLPTEAFGFKEQGKEGPTVAMVLDKIQELMSAVV